MRRIILWASAALVFAVLNGLVVQKERVLRSGRTVLLKLAPADPRSLIQGDYMNLAYEIARGPAASAARQEHADGRLVVQVDEHQVARFVRIYHGKPLAPDELLLRYRVRGGLRLGAESFLFQEGHAKVYERARYGELKVAPSGECVLVGLRDEKFNPLVPPPPAK